MSQVTANELRECIEHRQSQIESGEYAKRPKTLEMLKTTLAMLEAELEELENTK